MKNLLIISMIFTLILSGCKKNENSEVAKQPEYNPLSAMPVSGYQGLFTIKESRPFWPSAPYAAEGGVGITGRFQSPEIGALNAINLNAGDLRLNGVLITRHPDDTYHDDRMTPDIYSGTTVVFSLSGDSASGIDSITRSIYLPEKIYQTSPTTKSLFKSQTNLIEWDADPNYSGLTYIRVRYNGSYSYDNDSTLSETDIIYSDEVSDANGTFTIPSGWLNSMPTGAKVEILIGRGNYIDFTTGGKKVLLSAATITHTHFDLKN